MRNYWRRVEGMQKCGRCSSRLSDSGCRIWWQRLGRGPPPHAVMRTVAPVSPGEMLDEEFLKPLGLSKYRLAKDIGVPAQRIGDIVAGKRAITADTDLRLCRYFGLSDGWWLRGQANYDTAIARETMGEALARISRCELLAS